MSLLKKLKNHYLTFITKKYLKLLSKIIIFTLLKISLET